MTEEFKRDVRAFLRSLAGECANCFRRNHDYCDNCYSQRAKLMLDHIDDNARPNPALRCDIISRMARISAILKKVRRPMLCVEIDMRDYGSKSSKEFTLRTMMRLGKIDRKPAGVGGKYLYFLAKRKSTTTNTKGK